MSFWNFFGYGFRWGSSTDENSSNCTYEYEGAQPTTTTENGAPSYETTGDARLDLFGKISRDTPYDTLMNMLDASWEIDQLDTLRLIFYIRDCRGGTGERRQFFRAINWLQNKSLRSINANMVHIPFYGRYKDLLEIVEFNHNAYDYVDDEYSIRVFHSANICVEACRILARQLIIDESLIGTSRSREITLAGKYAPSERGHYDKSCNAVKSMCTLLGCDKKTYRKKYLVPLRKAANVVERQMTDNPEDWHTIDFSKVPAVALKKYKKAWMRHEAGRYSNWLEAVNSGKVKMNVLRLMPHQIVEPYFLKNSIRSILDQTVEAQWTSFVNQTRTNLSKIGSALKVVSVIDTSGSMFTSGRPAAITVALSLGLLLAELTEGPFANKFITFSESPTVENVKGDTLLEKLENMSSASWGANTNVEAVFDLILNESTNNVRGETMSIGGGVDTVFVFSDMQWDACSSFPSIKEVDTDSHINEPASQRSSSTASTTAPASRRSLETASQWQLLDEKFAAKSLKRPRFVFWNVTGRTLDFPIPSEAENACYISGFSADILKAILENRNLSPVDLMLSVIRSERYSRITLPARP